MALERFYHNEWANSYIKPVSLFKSIHKKNDKKCGFWANSVTKNQGSQIKLAPCVL